MKIKRLILWGGTLLLAAVGLVFWARGYAAVNAKYPSITEVLYAPGETGDILGEMLVSVGNLQILEPDGFITKYKISEEDVSYLDLRDTSRKMALVDITITYNGEEESSPYDLFFKYIPYLQAAENIDACDSMFFGIVNENNSIPEKLNKGDTYTLTGYFAAYRENMRPATWENFKNQKFRLVIHYYPKSYIFEVN